MDLKGIEKQSPQELFSLLLKVMEQLRGPEGCPWDKKQTHASLISCLLEESYEVLAAIDSGNLRHLSEELGDLLLQVVFHSQIASENHEFQIKDVLKTLIEKLVRRHPHVFADAQAKDPEEAIRRWEKIKASEKNPEDSILSGVPLQLPSLLRAYRIGTKASRVGFDWKNMSGVLEKIREELEELDQGMEDLTVREEEFGDLLFTLAQAARFLKLDPEEALRKSTLKFQKRFEWMEREIKKEKREISEIPAKELEEYWKISKSSTASVKNL